MSAISDGLPGGRDDWPAAVLAASARFACGDVVEDPPLFYFADPQYPVWERTQAYTGGSTGPEIIDAGALAPPFAVITSQTCDVGQIDFEAPSHPWVQIAPIFDGAEALDGPIRSLLRGGKQIGPFLHLPALTRHRSGFWVADFRIEMPVEKSWLVGREPLQGFDSEVAARAIPDALHALRGRPAWADAVVKAVGGTLSDELRKLKSSERETYQLVRTEVVEIGARADSMLTPNWVQVAAFYEGSASPSVQQWWDQASVLVGQALTDVGIGFHEPMWLDLDECPVSLYRTFSTMPLSRHSP